MKIEYRVNKLNKNGEVKNYTVFNTEKEAREMMNKTANEKTEKGFFVKKTNDTVRIWNNENVYTYPETYLMMEIKIIL